MVYGRSFLTRCEHRVMWCTSCDHGTLAHAPKNYFLLSKARVNAIALLYRPNTGVPIRKKKRVVRTKGKYKRVSVAWQKDSRLSKRPPPVTLIASECIPLWATLKTYTNASIQLPEVSLVIPKVKHPPPLPFVPSHYEYAGFSCLQKLKYSIDRPHPSRYVIVHRTCSLHIHRNANTTCKLPLC